MEPKFKVGDALVFRGNAAMIVDKPAYWRGDDYHDKVPHQWVQLAYSRTNWLGPWPYRVEKLNEEAVRHIKPHEVKGWYVKWLIRERARGKI